MEIDMHSYVFGIFMGTFLIALVHGLWVLAALAGIILIGMCAYAIGRMM